MRVALVLVASAVVIGACLYVARGEYVSLRQKRLVKQGRAFLASDDRKNALLCAQNALRHDARDVHACRLMADIAAANRSRSAMLWRARTVELSPRSLDDRLALAQTALMMRDQAAAINALEGADAAEKRTAAYHNVAGLVDATAGQLPSAEIHFAEASRLEPENEALQLNLSLIRLSGTNVAARESARVNLERLAANPSNSVLRCRALRGLATDALSRKQIQSSLEFSSRLLQETNAEFSDHFLRLSALQEAGSEQFRPALADCQRQAAGDPAKIYELAMWQLARTSATETLAWLGSLPASVRTNQPAALLITQCYASLGDWTGLQAWLAPQNWADLEFLRHAFAARAQRAQGLYAAAGVEWELAVKATGQQNESLLMLLNLAGRWQWSSEAEELLWVIIHRFPDDQRLFQVLHDSLLAGGRTRSLLQLYHEETKRSPSNLAIKNNLAMTALLLDAQELKPRELARAVYENSPTNALYASTYAFSLFTAGKSQEALRTMEQLSESDLKNPGIAGYYGLILQANGDHAKAGIYLDIALGGRLLPEERKLFAQTKAEL